MFFVGVIEELSRNTHISLGVRNTKSPTIFSWLGFKLHIHHMIDAFTLTYSEQINLKWKHMQAELEILGFVY